VEFRLGKHISPKISQKFCSTNVKICPKEIGCKQAIHYGTMALPLYDNATIKIGSVQ